MSKDGVLHVVAMVKAKTGEDFEEGHGRRQVSGVLTKFVYLERSIIITNVVFENKKYVQSKSNFERYPSNCKVVDG